jgi:hypothetical protein|tara:strand:- start:342 stop:1286 length:945 start_codon:yes stop_codon:yes gene_type:complete
MKNRIAFYGASVTRQVNGYWEYFARLNPDFEVSPFGNGAMHLNDAGICYIDDVIDYEPEICFIDWFSTGYIVYGRDMNEVTTTEQDFQDIKQYINTIVYSFLSKNIKLVFLTFPDKSLDSRTGKPVEKEEIYKKINSYIDGLGIPTIDISESFEDLKIILRDGIHTTPFGAEQYAKLINEEFKTLYNTIEIPTKYPERNEYCGVKRLELGFDVFNKLVLGGPCKVIGISQSVGPYTGLVDIDGVVINNWDRWCYYERGMVLMRFDVGELTTINVLEDSFDRSVCEHSADWTTKKQLKLDTVFYAGEQLKVIEYK